MPEWLAVPGLYKCFVPYRIFQLSRLHSERRVQFTEESKEQIFIALRRIVRAIDLHSRQLVQQCGLTGPQVALLRALVRHGEMHVAELAHTVDLSHATVTDILNRLEGRGLVSRARSQTDRRRIQVRPTREARAVVAKAPPLLQERFSNQLADLEAWELSQILTVLQRLATMMSVRPLDAAEDLESGLLPADATVDTNDMTSLETLHDAI